MYLGRLDKYDAWLDEKKENSSLLDDIKPKVKITSLEPQNVRIRLNMIA